MRSFAFQVLGNLAFVLVLMVPAAVLAQSSGRFNLYEQTSEAAGLVIRYAQDVRAIRTFYSPMAAQSRGFGERVYVFNSPEERIRLQQVDQDYLKQLKALDFDAMSVYGKVDYILLKRNIDDHLLELSEEESKYKQIEQYLPFAKDVYELERKRRRGAALDGQKVGEQLSQLASEVEKATDAFKVVGELEMSLAVAGEDALKGLSFRLRSVYDFYNGYDPLFSWWVPQPFKALDSTLTAYSKVVRAKGKLISTQKDDVSGIKGVPIGRDKLLQQLRTEMISYTPQHHYSRKITPPLDVLGL